MSIVVNTNIQSLIGQNSLNRTTSALNKVMEQVSTGLRINSAKDDAASIGVADLMTSNIRGNAQAMDNIQDGLNCIQTAEGSLTVIAEDIQRIRELCLQAANEIHDENSKQSILNEIKQRLETINSTVLSTNFNGKKLLDGSVNSLYIQIGPNGDAASADPFINAIDIAPSLTDCQTDALGIDLNITTLGSGVAGGAIDGSTWETQDIRDYITKLDAAITQLANDRSKMGAYMNAMESTAENLSTMNTNLESARSRIKDVDIAEASSDMVRYQILQQISTSILAQANQLPSVALSLLAG